MRLGGEASGITGTLSLSTESHDFAVSSFLTRGDPPTPRIYSTAQMFRSGKGLRVEDKTRKDLTTFVFDTTRPYPLQPWETCSGTRYRQSRIMTRVSLSLVSWKGGAPHTNMYRITPRDQISGINTHGTEIGLDYQIMSLKKMSPLSAFRSYLEI